MSDRISTKQKSKDTQISEEMVDAFIAAFNSRVFDKAAFVLPVDERCRCGQCRKRKPTLEVRCAPPWKPHFPVMSSCRASRQSFRWMPQEVQLLNMCGKWDRQAAVLMQWTTL